MMDQIQQLQGVGGEFTAGSTQSHSMTSLAARYRHCIAATLLCSLKLGSKISSFNTIHHIMYSFPKAIERWPHQVLVPNMAGT